MSGKLHAISAFKPGGTAAPVYFLTCASTSRHFLLPCEPMRHLKLKLKTKLRGLRHQSTNIHRNCLPAEYSSVSEGSSGTRLSSRWHGSRHRTLELPGANTSWGCTKRAAQTLRWSVLIMNGTKIWVTKRYMWWMGTVENGVISITLIPRFVSGTLPNKNQLLWRYVSCLSLW
jgi:hypothetical protein